MQGRWKTLLRLGLAGILAALSISVYLADAHLKQWPGDGLTLENSDIVVASGNFPASWSGLLATENGQGVTEALSRQLGDIERAVRLSTGIRPTPMRWKLWLGERMLVSHEGSMWLACFRPGLLLRSCYWSLQRLGHLESTDGTEIYGKLHLLWRDGYFLVSNTANLSVHAGPTLPTPHSEAPWMHAWLSTPEVPERPPLLLSLAGSNELPLELAWDRVPSATVVPTRETPRKALDTDETWQPMVDVHARESDLWEELPVWDLIAHFTSNPREVVLRHAALAPNFPEDFPYPKNSPEMPVRQVLFDIVASKGHIMKYTGQSAYQTTGAWSAHPFATLSLDPPLQQVPFAWGATEGFLAPVLGDDFTFGCALQGAWAHTANPPEHLAHLLRSTPDAAWSGPDLRVVIDWKQLAPALQQVVQQQVLAGLLPGDPRAFDVEYAPWTRALEALGQSELSSADDGSAPDRFRLRGRLADAP